MAESNPYEAPKSDVEFNNSEFYQPKILSFKGRIGRLRYLVYTFTVYMVYAVILYGIFKLISLKRENFFNQIMGELSFAAVGFALLVYVPLVIGILAMAKRRLNDLNWNSWFSFLYFIPVINVLLLFYLLFGPGTDGVNRFGPPPDSNSIGIKIAAFVIIGIILILTVQIINALIKVL